MAVTTTVVNILESMDYGPVIEGFALAEAWLKNKSKKLSPYIDGKFVRDENLSNGFEAKDQNSSLLAFVLDASPADIDNALKSSTNAFKHWNGLSPYSRARHLYNIARHLQQNASMLIQMESLVRGVQTRDPREWDVPGMIRMFYHHAGWAQMFDSEFTGWKGIGIVVGITSQVTPMQALSWIVAPALAAGCCVVLKPSRKAAITSLLLAELCTEAGLPDGVLNVITGPSEAARHLATNSYVEKVTFFGSTQTGRLVRQEAAEHGKSVTLLMSSRTPMIVLESADLNSACEGVIESAWFNQGQVPWAVTDVFVQQSVFKTFLKKLESYMKKLRLGKAFDKIADVGCPCKLETAEAVHDLIAKKKKEGSEVLSISEDHIPSTGKFIVPTIIIGGNNSDANVIKDDPWPLPVVFLNPFRTAKESVSLANNSRYSIAASIWDQDYASAEEIAHLLQKGTVWINCVNKFDGGVPFGASRQSGFGRIGGKEGIYEYLVPESVNRITEKIEMGSESETSGKQNGSSTVPKVDRTYKLYYGGAHKRPDGNSTIIVKDFEGKPYAMVADGSRKDIRNAVEAASKAQPGWNDCGSHLRSQILFYFAENLEMRSKEFAAELSRLLGRAEKDALQEIQQCIECLFFWAGVSDKNPISTCEPPPLPESKVNVFIKHDPMGVIGIVSPSSSFPLLTAVSIMAPAIALGNAVVMVPSQKCPLPALWLCQIIDTSDIPAGIINIITGNAESLGVTLASHHDVNSLWSSDIETCKNIKENYESFANHSMKPIWFWKEKDSCCWNKPRTVYHTEFYLHSTKTKAVWKPIGAIFAN